MRFPVDLFFQMPWASSLLCILFLQLQTSLSDHGEDNAPTTPTLYYKEHRIRTEQLCPDIQENVLNQDIDTANYPYKSVFKLADQVWRTSDPCVFESRGVRNQFSTVVVKAIKASNQAWNFSGALPCHEHIKLKIPSHGIYSKTGLPLCTIRKPPVSGPQKMKLFQGPFYHPHIWQLPRQKMGISFSLYENETRSAKDDDDESSENNEIIQPNNNFNILENAKLPRFIQLVFFVYFGDTCSIRVQQYLYDTNRCAGGRLFELCGMYNCSRTEEERVLKQAGFWSESLHISEMHKLIDFMRTKPYRQREEPSVMDFFINFMRLMIMPIVFFVAYYVTRQLREKLANRQVMLHSRATSQLSGGIPRGSGSRSVSRHAVVDSPASSRRNGFEDPPPSYDTILTPPSYMEATTFKNDILVQAAASSFSPGINVVGIRDESLPQLVNPDPEEPIFMVGETRTGILASDDSCVITMHPCESSSPIGQSSNNDRYENGGEDERANDDANESEEPITFNTSAVEEINEHEEDTENNVKPGLSKTNSLENV